MLRRAQPSLDMQFTQIHSARDASTFFGFGLMYGAGMSNFRGSLVALLRAGASLHNCSRGKSAKLLCEII